MKFSRPLCGPIIFLSGLNLSPQINSLSITLDKTDTAAATWDERNIKQIPKPILGAFADHLHTIASLFSSLIGTGAYTNNEGTDAIDCQHTSIGHGPYCLISSLIPESSSNTSVTETSSICYKEFGCEFYDSGINFNNQARLCCFKGYENKQFEKTFVQTADFSKPIRLFQPNQNNVGKSYNVQGHEFKVMPGHFGIAELIYVPNPKPDTKFTILENLWGGCLFADAVGYHSIGIMPDDNKDYGLRELDETFVENSFSFCAVESNGTKIDIKNEDVRTLMPYCTFKLAGQECPPEAPLAMHFTGDTGLGSFAHKLPNDNLYTATTYIDNDSFCCAKSDHDTRETTRIEMNYLKNSNSVNSEADIYTHFKKEYQVLKWPHADCAEFVYPKFDLQENKVRLTNKKTYPWALADMELSFCTYTVPKSLEDIFNPPTASPFDEYLSSITVPEGGDNEILSKPCDESNPYCQDLDSNVLPENLSEVIVVDRKVDFDADRDQVTTVNSVQTETGSNNIPSIITVNDHSDQYLDDTTEGTDEADMV